MKKWLVGAVEKVTQRVAKKAGEVAAEQAKKQAAARVEDMKTSAKDALKRAERALFGADSETAADEGAGATGGKRNMKTHAETPAARRLASSSGEGGSLQRAREEADRMAAERIASEAAKADKDRTEIDDELAAMKRKLGKR